MLKPLVRVSLALVVLLALFCGTALAQPAQPDLYVVVSYIKVAPGQEDAYRAYVTTTGKKLFQELMAANANFVSWTSARMMYAGLEHGADFDYVGASIYLGPPPEPGTAPEAAFMKATGMSQADLNKKLATMRTVVGTEVLRNRARVTGPDPAKEGDFRVLARMRIAPGMADEYYQMAETVTAPVAQARAAAGEFKSWSVWSRVFPNGAATAYDALSVTYFKDLAGAIKGLDAAKGAEAFQKAHPGKSYAAYVNNGRDYAQLQQRFVTQIIARLDRAR
jgi:hypothetical protein